MRYTIAAVLALVTTTPAFAQDGDADTNRDRVTIGVGAATIPRYEGSGDNTIVPAAAAIGSLGGIDFSLVGSSLFTDLIQGPDGPGVDIILGPVVHATLNRTSRKRTRDVQIVALGKIDTAIEVGAQAGIKKTGVITSEYDTLSFSVGGLRDVTNTHDSWIFTPTVNYVTPLSKTILVGAGVAASHVGSGYGRTYFGVNGAQSVASGLPVYNPGKGWKDVNFSLFGNISLSGDLRRGLSIFAGGNYERLLGDFKRSPVVRDSGQWIGAVGLAYTF